MKKVMILGVEISDISQDEALKNVQSFLGSPNQHYIVTPNPEIVLAASKSPKLRYVFDKADLSLPDGFGLKIGAWILGQKLANRVTGADFMLQIAALAAKQKRSMFLLGGKEGIARVAAQKLQETYPGINIAGAFSGGKVIKKEGEWVTSDQDLLAKINRSRAEILFVGFGCPKQEKWLFHNLAKLDSVKLAMTVGGSLDFLSGRSKRAPQKIRQLGLEWLWRLMREPQRLGRIWNATFNFLWRVLTARFRIAFSYRPNVVGFITNDKNEVLLVQRANEKYEHWQLPQGGVDKGESEEQAVLREMREEVGATNLKIIGKHPEQHIYDWSTWHQLRGGYKGQKQTIFYLLFDHNSDKIAIDEKEIKNYQWVDLDKVVSTVHPLRRGMTEMAAKGYKEKMSNFKA